MQVPKTQGLKGPGACQSLRMGRGWKSFSPFTFLKIIKSYWEKGVISPPLCVASEPPSSPPGTLGTVTVAPRSLNAHPKKEIGVLKLLEIHWNGQFYHYHVILYHFNIFCDPTTRYFLAPAEMRAQSAQRVFVKTGQCLSRYCTPYVCWQLYYKGKRIWMFAQTNWLAGLNYYRLSTTKMITMQLRCAYSENANQLCL